MLFQFKKLHFNKPILYTSDVIWFSTTYTNTLKMQNIYWIVLIQYSIRKKKSKQRFLKRDDIWGGIIVRIELREYLLVIYNNVPLKLFANAQQP